jgi:hypothetical protein
MRGREWGGDFVDELAYYSSQKILARTYGWLGHSSSRCGPPVHGCAKTEALPSARFIGVRRIAALGLDLSNRGDDGEPRR